MPPQKKTTAKARPMRPPADHIRGVTKFDRKYHDPKTKRLTRRDGLMHVQNAVVWMREDTGHLSGGAYDSDAHNVCVAEVLHRSGDTSFLFAFSDTGRLRGSNDRRAFWEVPDSAAYGDRFGLSAMQAAHTEPKLLNFILYQFPSAGDLMPVQVTLATSRDPCKSCTKVIATYRGWFPGRLRVYGYAAEETGGMPLGDGREF